MKWLPWVRAIMEIGMAAIEAVSRGETEKTVWDVLPEEYRDRAKLKSLEEQAREDYSK